MPGLACPTSNGMTYFLDFDRTIFDTESFLPYLAGFPALSHLRTAIHSVLMKGRGQTLSSDEDREELWKTINEMYKDGSLEFKDRELAPFVFPDAVEFLEEHGSQSVVVTSAGFDNLFQERKLTSSGVAALVVHTEFVIAGNPKGPVIAKLLELYPAPYVFIDDLVPQINSVALSCPSVTAYEMRRDRALGAGKYPVIQSFAELS